METISQMVNEYTHINRFGFFVLPVYISMTNYYFLYIEKAILTFRMAQSYNWCI